MTNKFTNQNFNIAKFNPLLNALQKLKISINGFWFIIKNDFSVTFKVFISIIFLVLSLIFRAKLDIILIIMSTGYMISAEIMNSCVELLCDFHETGINKKIKIIKDVASSATAISDLVWISVLFYEFYKLLTVFW